MSVQHDCILEPGPRRVRTSILGREVVADVLDREFEAEYNDHVGDVLTVRYNGSQYRVPASECDPV